MTVKAVLLCCQQRMINPVSYQRIIFMTDGMCKQFYTDLVQLHQLCLWASLASASGLKVKTRPHLLEIKVWAIQMIKLCTGTSTNLDAARQSNYFKGNNFSQMCPSSSKPYANIRLIGLQLKGSSTANMPQRPGELE